MFTAYVISNRNTVGSTYELYSETAFIIYVLHGRLKQSFFEFTEDCKFQSMTEPARYCLNKSNIVQLDLTDSTAFGTNNSGKNTFISVI